jgi:hypothetical protein
MLTKGLITITKKAKPKRGHTTVNIQRWSCFAKNMRCEEVIKLGLHQVAVNLKCAGNLAKKGSN